MLKGLAEKLRWNALGADAARVQAAYLVQVEALFHFLTEFDPCLP